MIGTVVGNYKVVEKIGEGGMGAVFKGIDLMLEREVAIKVLKPELASQPQVVERFRSEAVTLAKLNHPNIATLFSFFRQGDYFFMVLEFVNGTPIDKIIEAHGVMTCEQAIPLFSQMLEGIDHAHALGIIHRDIKPANMMLTETGLLKVLDFGIARALGSARMTRAGHLIGTIEYMSPEQVRGMDTDARSDIYSLGMVLYEMLTGRVPFASDSEFELMKAQVEQLPTPPREFVPSIPEQVEWAIMCATEKDPEKRFQTAGAFSDAIIDCVKRAFETGELSQIDMRRPTGRLNAAGALSDLLNARTSTGSFNKPSQPEATSSGESPLTQNAKLPPSTRLAASSGESMAAAYLKPTRLGDSSAFPVAMNVPAVSSAPAVPPGIFGSLNRKHLIAGGIGAVVLITAVLGLALLLILKGTRSTAENLEPGPTPSSSSSPLAPSSEETGRSSNPQTQPSPDRNSDGSQASSATSQDTENANSIPGSQNETRRASKAPKQDTAAREKARRRAMALKALDK